jgi:hypothetical protein
LPAELKLIADVPEAASLSENVRDAAQPLNTVQ